MAKKNKNKKEELDLIEDDDLADEDIDEDKPSKKKKGCLLKLLIFLIIISIPIVLISFDVGKVRTKYIRPGLERVPIIKNLLPPVKEEPKEKEEVKDEKQETIDSLLLEIDGLKKEVTRLKEFEQNQLNFKAEKEEFDKSVALNDPKAYADFYEKISPENAEELYKQAIQKNNTDKRFKNYIQTFEGMKKDAVSKVLEELMLTDSDLVIDILENLSNEKRSEILSAMDPKNAASISKLLAPIDSK